MKERIRVGIDVGGTDIKIGLVDDACGLVAWTSTPTGGERPAEAVAADMGRVTLGLLKEHGFSLDQCAGVGVGAPGAVDPERGVVVYANNVPWKDLPLAELLGAHLPVPIRLGNDAICAVLGEQMAGAGRGVRDLIMVTLGTGVGGGIILDGKVFTGCALGGTEIGHMVIIEDGEECTCGRRGCWEAYASATGLKREGRRATGKDLSPQEIFRRAGTGDPALAEVVDTYIRRVGLGLVNLVNIFRPRLILLGGGISNQGETLLAPLREMIARETIDGGELPRLERATLGNLAGMIGAAGLVQDG